MVPKKDMGLLKKITHRQPVIQYAMAMVAAVGLGSVQTHHHLVPGPICTQGFGPPCHSANGQPSQLSHHFLSLVHGVEAMDPKHDLDLHF